MTPEESMTPEKLTDETHIHVEGWGEMNDHPDIGLLAERIVDNTLDGGRRRSEESAERLAGLLVAFGEHLISAERTRADTLERERDALRDALMVAVRRANGCLRGCRVLPDGGVGWGADVCVCAKEASDAVESFTVRAPPAGGEKL